jgi:predicted transglutaminase-like cysteine proteinase
MGINLTQSLMRKLYGTLTAIKQFGARLSKGWWVFAWLFPVLTWSYSIDLGDAVLKWVETTYGVESRQRVQDWKSLLETSTALTEPQKLTAVNSFFNQLQFVDDARHWKKDDYWATPLEFLATGAGDCEDFSIAKYFTLIALGVDETKLRMTYVKALKLNQPHMVVTYFTTPDAVPLVLDNLVKDINGAGERPDLAPVYSFNGSGLWMARERGQGKLAGSSDRLGLWQDLLKRLGQSPK